MHLSDDRSVGARMRISVDADFFDTLQVTNCNDRRQAGGYITAPKAHGTNSFWP